MHWVRQDLMHWRNRLAAYVGISLLSLDVNTTADCVICLVVTNALVNVLRSMAIRCEYGKFPGTLLFIIIFL